MVPLRITDHSVTYEQQALPLVEVRHVIADLRLPVDEELVCGAKGEEGGDYIEAILFYREGPGCVEICQIVKTHSSIQSFRRRAWGGPTSGP